jgi:hypothetical protein
MIYRELQGYKYELMESMKYYVPKLAHITFFNAYLALENGKLIIGKGYAWDGPSGPTWDDKTNMRGSLIHDALYQILREGAFEGRAFVREHADELLRDICIEDGMNKLRANVWCFMVRHFAKRSSTSAQKPRGKIVTIKTGG